MFARMPIRPLVLLAGLLLAGAVIVTAASGAAAPGLPGGVTGLSGTAAVNSASVSFAASGSTAPPATSYTVTASPGAEQGFGTTSPITVTGLTPGSAYSFSVTAANGAGRGVGSAPSAPLTPLAPPTGSTAPAISALKASLVSFFAGVGAHSGTTLSWSDSVAATTTLTILRVRSGIVSAGSCVLHGRVAGRRHCQSLLYLGTLTSADVAGANTLHFSGRLAGRALAAGLYQVRLTPSLAGVPGNTLKTELDVF